MVNNRMEAAISESVKKLGYGALKREQYQIVKGFVCGNDVFGVLPTGFLCYACLPWVFEKLESEKCVIIVVTPLTAIMKDQVS